MIRGQLRRPTAAAAAGAYRRCMGLPSAPSGRHFPEIEHFPSECPNGHQLRPGRVLFVMLRPGTLGFVCPECKMLGWMCEDGPHWMRAHPLASLQVEE